MAMAPVSNLARSWRYKILHPDQSEDEDDDEDEDDLLPTVLS
jgi:hypothetical protein